jgi:L-histidine N-alpha-methyltransferase
MPQPIGASARVGRTRHVSDEIARMAEQVRQSLQQPLPSISSKFFYDDRGSHLFEVITRLPEYYQTRTEEALLERIAGEVVARSAARELVEIGSGAGRKIRMLLDAMREAGQLERCVLFDINELFVRHSIEALQSSYPEASLRGVVGDFQGDLTELGPGGDRLVIFLGGTLGNIERAAVTRFLGLISAQMAPGDGLLVGLDLVKDPERLHAAYNDSTGVTAAFNLNILNVLNERLDADFDLDAFEHVAFYDEELARIEMRLRALRDTGVSIPAADLELRFAKGDEIRTEISCKYTRDSLLERLGGTPLAIDAWYTDPEDLFALALLRRS